MPKKITVAEVNDFSQREFVERFGPLYEHSPWVAEEAWKARPFGSLDDLHEAMVRVVNAASEDRKIKLIQAHPDLAGRAAMSGELTLESTREQASAGLDNLTREEYETFTKINREYREKFGLPMVIAVREHTKESILKSAEARLHNSEEKEVAVALGEISKIARLRLGGLVEENRGRPETA